VENAKFIAPIEVLQLFVLTPECKNSNIVSAFNVFKNEIQAKKKKEAKAAFKELLKVSYVEIKDLQKSEALYAVYVEIVNTATMVTAFCEKAFRDLA